MAVLGVGRHSPGTAPRYRIPRPCCTLPRAFVVLIPRPSACNETHIFEHKSHCQPPTHACRAPKEGATLRHASLSHPRTSCIRRRMWTAGRLLGNNAPLIVLSLAGSNPDSSSSSFPDPALPSPGAAGEFCIIEGPDTLQDFARMQEEEIRDNIASRRNKIFLLMEEVRRLRIQQRLRKLERSGQNSEAEELPQFPSFIPFLPPLTKDNLREYYGTFIGLVFLIIMFGGLVAPTLELKLGIGGTSYAEFINSVGLPTQLSQVDPIVASFSGGAVGVLSALLVVEVNNVEQQEHRKCMYCNGSGYLACARCAGTGSLIKPTGEQHSTVTSSSGTSVQASEMRCPTCAGSAKVMCPTCLCTGRALATEHDPRIDPFD